MAGTKLVDLKIDGRKLGVSMATALDGFRAFTKAMAQVAAAARAAGAGLRRLRVNLDDLARARHGAGNQAADGTWQSDLCAAWVHDACPAGRLCDCTCHGGTVR